VSRFHDFYFAACEEEVSIAMKEENKNLVFKPTIFFDIYLFPALSQRNCDLYHLAELIARTGRARSVRQCTTREVLGEGLCTLSDYTLLLRIFLKAGDEPCISGRAKRYLGIFFCLEPF
jgi:hypothetical protein